MNKTLRVAFPIAETGFDPQAISDLYSDVRQPRDLRCRSTDYDYLARPYKLVPNTAAALPEITHDGRTWTIRIKPGIYFADDPAFKGKKRELTAARLRLRVKRMLDPKMRSPYLCYLFEGKLVGADALVAKAKKPASSTTTRRSKACRRSTATRCASSSSRPDYVLRCAT